MSLSISQYSAKNTQFNTSELISDQLKDIHINLNKNAIDRIFEIAKNLIQSDKNFKNIKKNEEPLLNNYKLQLFSSEEKDKVKIYISQKADGSAKNNFEVETFKRFSKAGSLMLNFDRRSNQQYDNHLITSVARLRMKYNLPISHNDNLANWRNEIKVLKTFSSIPHFCKLLSDALYQGNHNKYSINKHVMYQELYKHDLFTALGELGKMKCEEMKRVRSQIVNQTLSAVHKLHTLGYIHGDLKLENIFIDHLWNVHLGDFGSTYEKSSISKKATICGTYVTLAPELFHKITNPILNIEITDKIESWSIGCTLIALFNRGYPLFSSSMAAYFALRTFCLELEKYNDFVTDKEIQELLSELQKNAPITYKNFIQFKNQIGETQTFVESFFEKIRQNDPLLTLFPNTPIGIKACRDFLELEELPSKILELITNAPFNEKSYIETKIRKLNILFSKMFGAKLKEIQYPLIKLTNAMWRHFETDLEKMSIDEKEINDRQLFAIKALMHPNSVKRWSIEKALNFINNIT